MEIKRDIHLKRLIASQHDGMVKVVTGVRRCGKSYLLFKLFCDYLHQQGVDDSHIIKVALDDRINKRLRDPDALLQYVRNLIIDNEMYYILLDEVQLVSEFEDVLNSFLHINNADVYVSGSNAKFLSKDIVTEFRGRGHEIRITPLSFQEFSSVYKGPSQLEGLREYMLYGGLPQVVTTPDVQAKVSYLTNVFQNTYLVDIRDRYRIKNDAELDDLINIMASSIGSLTNPTKLANTFHTVKHSNITSTTIQTYLSYLENAFLLEKSMRYDIKGKRYIESPAKYYFVDLGLRNARLQFRQTEETHLMENLIYNELRLRGLSVDVGSVTRTERNEQGNSVRRQLEVDFVCNLGYKRWYIQSALALSTQEKVDQEVASLRSIGDSFRKIVITGGLSPTYQNEEGIFFLNILDFLKDENSLNL